MQTFLPYEDFERSLYSILGAIKSGLRTKPETLVVSKWKKTTKQCLSCGSERLMELKDRTYECASCGLSMERDLHSARRVQQEGLYKVPTDYREFMLAEVLPKAELLKQEDATFQVA